MTISVAQQEKGEKNRPVALHVIARLHGGWSVKKTMGTRALGLFENKKDAVELARDIARKESRVLFIHKRDGMVQAMSDYGKSHVLQKVGK